jgi:hypothetical protein
MLFSVKVTFRLTKMLSLLVSSSQMLGPVRIAFLFRKKVEAGFPKKCLPLLDLFD